LQILSDKLQDDAAGAGTIYPLFAKIVGDQICFLRMYFDVTNCFAMDAGQPQ
jgi:hypothetical protein